MTIMRSADVNSDGRHMTQSNTGGDGQEGPRAMMRRTLCALALLLPLVSFMSAQSRGEQRAFGKVWGGIYGNSDWERFYHYPYVFYPQNFWGQEYYRSSESLYYRYPNEMRIPVYNKKWHNYYPSPRPYHSGHHFILDVF